MRRPKHIGSKARTKAACGRIFARRWVKGPECDALLRGVMDRILERTVKDLYGLEVKVSNGDLQSGYLS